MSRQQPSQPVTLGPTANAAFVAVVVAAYVSLLAGIAEIEAPRLAALVVLGLVFTLVGLAGDQACVRFAGRFSRLVYFGFELIVGTAIMLLGRTGLISLIMFPIVSQAAASVTRGPLLIVCASALGAMVLPVAADVGTAAATQAALSFGAGLVFVVVFTRWRYASSGVAPRSSALPTSLAWRTGSCGSMPGRWRNWRRRASGIAWRGRSTTRWAIT